MSNVRWLRTKEELGREANRALIESRRLAATWSKRDAFVVGLSIENAIANAGYDVQDPKAKKEHEPAVRAAFQRHLWQEIELIEAAIGLILKYGNLGPRKLVRIVPVAFGMIICPKEEIERRVYQLLREKDVNLTTDFVSVRETLLHQIRSPAARILVAERGLLEGVGSIFKDWLTLRESVYRNAHLSTALDLGLEIRIEETDPPSYIPISDPKVDWDKVLLRDLTHPRLVDALMEPDKWATDFPEAAAKTLGSRGRGKGPANRRMIAKESAALLDGFAAFPGFEKTFRVARGLELESFFAITDSIATRAYARINCVLNESSEKLTRKVAKDVALPRKNVRAALDRLRLVNWPSAQQLLIYVDEDEIVTSFDQVSRFKHRILNYVFSADYDPHWRGTLFEKRCRELLSRAGFRVWPRRVQISRGLVPSAISVRLWGIEKRKTDLDVVAAKAGLLVLLECKQLKVSSRKSTGLHASNLFDKFREELYWKAKALATSQDTLKVHLTQPVIDYLGVESKVVYLVPTLVSNLPPKLYNAGIALVGIEKLAKYYGALLTAGFDAAGDPASELSGRVSLARETMPFVAFPVIA